MSDLRVWYDSLPSEGKSAFKLVLIVIGLLLAGFFNLFEPKFIAPFSFLVIALASVVFTFYRPSTYGGILTTILIVIVVLGLIFLVDKGNDDVISMWANTLSLWGVAVTLLVIIVKKAKTDTKIQDDEQFHSVDVKNRLKEWINSGTWKDMDRSKAKEMRKMLYKLRIPEYEFEPKNPQDKLTDKEKKELDEF
ncbi:hypothetical protein [Peribacillus sp. S4]|uniref:hypothetical protein n=1 Tax=Peribacillus sp. S4 TaxID=3384451 RepID=UPI0039899205